MECWEDLWLRGGEEGLAPAIMAEKSSCASFGFRERRGWPRSPIFLFRSLRRPRSCKAKLFYE